MLRILLTISLLCALGCSSADKPFPTDDPLVDDGAADSLRTPTLRGAAAPGDVLGDDFTATTQFVAWTLPLRAGQTVEVRLGGVAAAGGTLDTLLYAYGPKNAAGNRGHYITRNDDRSSTDYGSSIRFTASQSGEHLIVATTYTKPDAGHFALLIGCGQGACTEMLPPDAPRPPARASAGLFANPELVAVLQLHFGTHWNPNSTWPRAHVDALAQLVGADSAEDAATAASDAVLLDQALLAAGTQISSTGQSKLAGAITSFLGTPDEFQQLPARAQAIAMAGLRWDTGSATPPSSIDAVVNQLLQSWSGAQLDRARPKALTRGEKLYGWIADVGLSRRDSSGRVLATWDGLELFQPDGTYLGDVSSAPVIP